MRPVRVERVVGAIVSISTQRINDHVVPEGTTRDAYIRALHQCRHAFGRKRGKMLAELLSPFTVVHDLKRVKPAKRVTDSTAQVIVFWKEVHATRFTSVSTALQNGGIICVRSILHECWNVLLPAVEKELGETQMEILACVVDQAVGTTLRESCGIGTVQHPFENNLLVWKQREALATTIRAALTAACAYRLLKRTGDFAPLLASFRGGNPPYGFDARGKLLRYAVLP